MARNPKLSPGIQVFAGSRPRQDVFATNAGVGCCDNSAAAEYDKLAERTRSDNSLAHLNPLGGIDRFRVPYGDGFADTRERIINGINDNGVGFNISVLAIPTYAFVTGVAVHVASEEAGLTFDLVTRNGLVLPSSCVNVVDAAVVDCSVTRTLSSGTVADLAGFGGLGAGVAFRDILARHDGCGQFSLEADEIVLQVASMPASGIVNGSFDLDVSVSYEVLRRAEA